MAGRLSAMDIAFRPATSQSDGLSSPPEAGAVFFGVAEAAVLQFLDQLGSSLMGERRPYEGKSDMPPAAGTAYGSSSVSQYK